MMYYDGQGVPQDYGKAMEFFLKIDYDPYVLYHLGFMYDRGLGRPQDKSQAYVFYQSAFEVFELRYKDWLSSVFESQAGYLGAVPLWSRSTPKPFKSGGTLQKGN